MRFLVFVLAAACLSACGKQDAAETFSGGGETNGQACSRQVISDNDSYVRACSSMTTWAHGRLCKAEAQKFLAKYPGLRCSAIKRKDQSVMTISDTNVQEMVSQLEALGI